MVIGRCRCRHQHQTQHAAAAVLISCCNPGCGTGRPVDLTVLDVAGVTRDVHSDGAKQAAMRTDTCRSCWVADFSCNMFVLDKS